MGVPASILETVRSCYHAKTPLEATLHDGLTRLFRQHIAVGGMPEAVQGFLNRHRDLGESRTADADILKQYRYDITKYAGKSKMSILSIFDSIPGQLAKVNKRFALNSVRKDAIYEVLEDDFSWLSQILDSQDFAV